jgi:O-antigen ligase
MNPFMDDHTVYGAVCSIVLTYSVILLLSKKSGISFFERLLAFYISGCALIGVIFSYSRAAWLSLVFVFIFFLLLKLKIKFKTLLLSLLLILSVASIYHDELYQHIRFNKSASGKNLQTDIQSISNVKTDVSNVERLNRWEAGWRMFQDKPFFGFGPGTYMFKYSSYQRAHEMTIISTTQGTMGGMHSEYFGPMVESGFIGLLSILFLFGIFIKTAMENYYKAFNRENKLLNLAILLSLLSYFFHGLMNNFLDQDKASVIFWALMGMSSALSIKRKEDVNEISGIES